MGDTLEDDWPYFEDNDPTHTYKRIYVDAVVSNPPYSQSWDSTDKENDPRYNRYGLAPKSKADYAFLLHDLYHVKHNGIMTIVLPHGVLFRGGEEANIRKNLIEYNNIYAIIGLPPNIFFGTGIPTIIMVLRQKRIESDVLIIDASKGFIKKGKNNILQASDIKKIADTVKNFESIDKFSRVVSKEEIRQNEYNLNIPRYVDSSEKTESWDIYASIYGGIPNSEINELNRYWRAFPTLKKALFDNNDTPYSTLTEGDLTEVIQNNVDVINFTSEFNQSFNDFDLYLKNKLIINNINNFEISKEKSEISDNIFDRVKGFSLIDKYKAYQLFYNNWQIIATDLEIIKTEGYESIKKVDPNMVVKKNKGIEVQEGYIGHILPFELVQSIMQKKEVEKINDKENKLTNISAEYDEIFESLSEEEKESDYVNEDKTSFIKKLKSRQKNLKTIKLIKKILMNTKLKNR